MELNTQSTHFLDIGQLRYRITVSGKDTYRLASTGYALKVRIKVRVNHYDRIIQIDIFNYFDPILNPPLLVAYHRWDCARILE